MGRGGGRRIRRSGQRIRRHAASGQWPSVDGQQEQGWRHATCSPLSSSRAAATRPSINRRQGQDSRRSASSPPSTTNSVTAARHTSAESDACGFASAAAAAAAAAAWLAPIFEEGRQETERGPGGRQVWLCEAVRGRWFSFILVLVRLDYSGRMIVHSLARTRARAHTRTHTCTHTRECTHTASAKGSHVGAKRIRKRIRPDLASLPSHLPQSPVRRVRCTHAGHTRLLCMLQSLAYPYERAHYTHANIP